MFLVRPYILGVNALLQSSVYTDYRSRAYYSSHQFLSLFTMVHNEGMYVKCIPVQVVYLRWLNAEGKLPLPRVDQMGVCPCSIPHVCIQKLYHDKGTIQ